MSSAEFDLRMNIMDYARRSSLVLAELVAKQPFASALRIKDVRVLLQTMAHQERLLRQAPFDARRYYYYLSPRGAKLLGDQSARTSPLPERDKLRAYAIAAFCSAGAEPRLRLHRQELLRFRSEDEAELSPRYYVSQRPNDSRLGHLRPDLGGNGRWDRVVHQCRRDMRWHMEHALFSTWLAAGRFEFAVITATEPKAARIRRALAEIRIKHSITMHVFVLSELLPLLFPLPEQPP